MRDRGEAGALDPALRRARERIAPLFRRRETRRHAFAYLRGLLSDLERKNGWTLAQHAGLNCPDGVHRLLTSPCWSARELMAAHRALVIDALGPGGVLIADDTGFVKKGRHSAGVQRQYTGTSGKIDNCQLGVFLAYATAAGRALLAAELYLPRSWMDDPDQRTGAAVPAELTFATKPELALAMLRQVTAEGLAWSWFTGDEAFAENPKLRAWLEEHHRRYVLAVSVKHYVHADGNKIRVDALLARRAERLRWRCMPAGLGAHGPRFYHWAVLDTDDPAVRVLVRRSISTGELAFYRCHAPGGAEPGELVPVAGTRWAIEECFQAAKNETGLDHFQVRRYDAWYGHIALAMLAHGVLAVAIAAARSPGLPPPPPAGHDHEARQACAHADTDALRPPWFDEEMIPLTVNEIRRLHAQRHRPDHGEAHRQRWSVWRRRRQAQALRCHYRRRLRAHGETRLQY